MNANTVSHLFINIFVISDIIFAEICHTKSKKFDFWDMLPQKISFATCCRDLLPESADITNDIFKTFYSIIPLSEYYRLSAISPIFLVQQA